MKYTAQQINIMQEYIVGELKMLRNHTYPEKERVLNLLLVMIADQRIETPIQKKGCGKVICANTDYDGKMIICGEYGDELCDACAVQNTNNHQKLGSNSRDGELGIDGKTSIGDALRGSSNLKKGNNTSSELKRSIDCSSGGSFASDKEDKPTTSNSQFLNKTSEKKNGV